VHDIDVLFHISCVCWLHWNKQLKLESTHKVQTSTKADHIPRTYW